MLHHVALHTAAMRREPAYGSSEGTYAIEKHLSLSRSNMALKLGDSNECHWQRPFFMSRKTLLNKTLLGRDPKLSKGICAQQGGKDFTAPAKS